MVQERGEGMAMADAHTTAASLAGWQDAALAADGSSDVTQAPSSRIGKELPIPERILDQVRAGQTQAILELTSSMMTALSQGFTVSAAQMICDLLLPATDAVAVAITSTEIVMGYAGVDKESNPIGGGIRTAVTRDVVEHGGMRVVRRADQIGFPDNTPQVNAAIVAALQRSGTIVGSLKFYYASAEFLTETQQAIARGFAEMLSNQMDAIALDEQRRVATSMELKMLQSQINPHFLFNTINTIAALMRTDPARARILLREFATFYRRTLEDSSDLLPLWREVDQTERFLSFAVARFGEDRLQFASNIPEEFSEYLVPAFLVQPLVENAVRHAMPSEGTLHIQVDARRHEDALIVTITDDGIGMSNDMVESIERPSDEGEGLGMAMRNIKERIRGYYGPDSRMSVQSTPGAGTTVELYLHNACRID